MSLGRPPEGTTNNPDGCSNPGKELDCPACGRTVQNLPNHMRACAEVGSDD